MAVGGPCARTTHNTIISYYYYYIFPRQHGTMIIRHTSTHYPSIKWILLRAHFADRKLLSNETENNKNENTVCSWRRWRCVANVWNCQCITEHWMNATVDATHISTCAVDFSLLSSSVTMATTPSMLCVWVIYSIRFQPKPDERRWCVHGHTNAHGTRHTALGK